MMSELELMPELELIPEVDLIPEVELMLGSAFTKTVSLVKFDIE